MILPEAFHSALAARYTIERELGSGGMATVFLARDLKHDRLVALKVMEPGLAATVGAERFLEEIRVTANLHHPHLLPLFDSGEAAGLLFYVMPYIDGESLRARLARDSRLPIAEAVRIGAAVASAVDYAHRHGVIHRDLKPENILLQDGQPLVADFGIALASSSASPTRLTEAGLSVGTPQYMSPEQATGDRVLDARSDVYALGTVIYEMLAGRPPHEAGTAPAVMARILSEPPTALREHRPDVPAPLESAIMRALAKTPEARWATVGEFGQALDATARTAATRSGRQWMRPAVAVVAVVLLLAAALGLWRQPDGAPGTAPVSTGSDGLHSLAVLPFDNLGANQEDEYFSDGLTEELLHELAQVAGLRVAARTSSFAFKGQRVEPGEVARRLNVDGIVSGSVRRSGTTLRVTAQLIDAASGGTLWSEQYERQSDDAFQVQDEIARAIVARLGVRETPVDPVAATPADVPDPEAFDLYLQGRFAWNRRTEAGAREAITLLEAAIGRAPGYARAHGALAEAYAVIGFYDYLPPRQAFTAARAAAEQALALDPAMADAHSTLGYVALYYDRNLARAEREFQKALELGPHYAVAHQWYGNALTVMGRFDEAFAAFRKAQELDPLSPIAQAALGWSQMYARQYEDAEQQLRATLVAHPRYFLAQLWLGETLERQSRLDEAAAAFDEALTIAPGNVLAELARARTLALQGRQRDAADRLARVERQSSYVAAYPRALVLVALGDHDGAFRLLRRALDDRAHAIAFLDIDPWLDPLRRDVRFAALQAEARPATR